MLFFSQVLNIKPTNGFAKSHLGFILKTDHLRYVEAIPLLRDGISSGEPGADDGRFYFHLGDALTRVGKPDEVRLLAGMIHKLIHKFNCPLSLLFVWQEYVNGIDFNGTPSVGLLSHKQIHKITTK